jgi:hypothetical protein
MATADLKYDDTNQFNRTIFPYWDPLAVGDDGQWLEVPNHTDIHFTAGGDYSGGLFVLEGTDFPDKSNPVTLVYAKNGTAISHASAAQGGQVLDAPRFIRPKLTGGTGSVQIYMKINKAA